jgi:hypothetical protein
VAVLLRRARTCGRNRLALAACCAVVALGAPALVHGASAAESFTLADDFEAQSLGAWSSEQNVRLVRRAATGSFAARAISTDDEPGALVWDSGVVEQGHRYARVSGWTMVSWARQGESVDTFSVKNDNGVNHFDFFVDDVTGRWKWDLLQTDSAVSTMTVERGEWYYVEALVDFGGPQGSTYTAEVRINGVPQPSITSRDRTGTTVRGFRFGAFAAGKSNVRYYDDIAVQVGDDPFGFGAVPGPNSQ